MAEYQQAVRELEASGQPLKLSIRPPAPGDAGTRYREAAAAMNPMDFRIVDTVGWRCRYETGALNFGGISAGYLYPNRRTIHLAIVAARCPSGGFVTATAGDFRSRLRLTRFAAPDVLGRELIDLVDLAEILAFDCLSDPKAGLPSLDALIAFGLTLGREPLAPYQRAGARAQRVASAVLLQLLEEGRWYDEDPRPWIERVRGGSQDLDVGSALASHRAVVLEQVQDLLSRRSHIPPDGLPLAPRLGGRFFDDRLCREALLFLRAIEEVIDLSRRPYWEVAPRIREIDEELAGAASNGVIVLDEIQWELSDYLSDVADARTAREIAAAGLALLAHRREAGAWPAELRPPPVDHRTGHAGYLEIRDDDAWIVFPDRGEWRVRPR